MRRATRHSPRAQRGVGLVEVLISVLVLSFGMLGLVSLQLFTIKNNQSSLERGMAVVQSHSIIDIMRADRSNAINDAFDIGLDAKDPSGTSFIEKSLATWRANLRSALGNGAKGAVDCTGALCTITVQWDDARAQSGQTEAQDDESDAEDSSMEQVITVVQL